ncbi:hypothetical protein OIU84_024949 [Salix udensis]|uniref:Uncharacterized protein n=1 Tax=Salix udensis TaxID=889485 RepID=A0AAD6KKL9_9ROSI|nr:hypothetical protein OIU84_024949 [Salix udensis]
MFVSYEQLGPELQAMLSQLPNETHFPGYQYQSGEQETRAALRQGSSQSCPTADVSSKRHLLREGELGTTFCLPSQKARLHLRRWAISQGRKPFPTFLVHMPLRLRYFEFLVETLSFTPATRES